MARLLNLGCGPYPLEGYINIDINRRQKADLIRDLRRGLPYDDSSVDGITASHFLEHLPFDEMLFVLEECWRVMKPKTQIKIVVPLMDFSAIDHRQYLSKDALDILWRDAPEQFDRNFNWGLCDKQVRTDSLHVTLEAVK